MKEMKTLPFFFKKKKNKCRAGMKEVLTCWLLMCRYRPVNGKWKEQNDCWPVIGAV